MSIGRLLRLLWDNTALACVLAAAGLTFIGCGIATIWMTAASKSEPVSLTMQELEAADTLPDVDWLACREGYLFWPAVRQQTKHMGRAGVDPAYSTTTEGVYVPLLSKSAFDNWYATLQRDGPGTFFSYSRCRVLVKYSLKDLREQFPQVATALSDKRPIDQPIEPQKTVSGTVRPVSEIDKKVADGLSQMTSGFDPKMILVMEQGQAAVDNRAANCVVGIILCVIGGISLTPVGVWAVRRMLGRNVGVANPREPN